MELKKTSKADLENKRGLFFEIGLIITLTLVLIAFEWPSQSSGGSGLTKLEDFSIEEEIIPITRQEKELNIPPPPKPKIAEILSIVDDDVIIEDEFIISDVEADQETEFEISEYYDIPVDDEIAEDEVFFIVEDMPKFHGKGQSEFRKFIAENLQYPEIALENCITGTVYVEFTINQTGEVTDLNVLRSVDPALDAEAARVIKSSPSWTPGKQRGTKASECPIYLSNQIYN